MVAGDRGKDRSRDSAQQASLRQAAAELLSQGAVELVIGYGASPSGDPVPCFARTAEKAAELLWNERCVYNLTRYLTERELLGAGRGGERSAADEQAAGAGGAGGVAVTLKGCDLKSLVVLLAERQVRRETLKLIGLSCAGVVDEGGRLLGKCESCPPEVRTPPQELCDVVIADPAAVGAEAQAGGGGEFPDVAELDGLSTPRRRAFWDGHFARCLRCYACRNVCPLCYCKECVFDQSNPRWVSPAAGVSSNRAFHLIRAYHLAGRCVDCGECERACPVGIPLRRINRKMIQVVKASFDFVPGVDPQAKAPIAAFAAGDPEGFIE